MSFCRGHQVLAGAEVPKDAGGQPLAGFFPYLRPATDDDFDDPDEPHGSDDLDDD